MLLWKLWKERNQRIFNDKALSTQHVIYKIKMRICEIENIQIYDRRIKYITDWGKKYRLSEILSKLQLLISHLNPSSGRGGCGASQAKEGTN